MRHHRYSLPALLLPLAVAAVIAAPGATANDEPENSFAGSCSVQGDNKFSPPLTNTQGSLTYDYSARGTCSGTLNGRNVSDAPVSVRQSGRAYGSCSQAHSTSPGLGALTFTRSTGSGDDVTISYTLEFTVVFTEVDFTIKGQRSGTAKAHGSFLTTRTPPDAVAKCAGEGNAELPLDMSLTTDSPLVSDRRCDGMSQTVSSRSSCRRAAARRDYKAPRIRLAGVPRKRCARRAFRARGRIAERWSGLRRARLSLDGRRLLVTRNRRFSRRIPAGRLRPGRHRLTVVALDKAGNRSVKKARFRACRPHPG